MTILDTDAISPSQRAILINWRRLSYLPPLGWTIDARREHFVRDPVYFSLVRGMWDLVLKGTAIDEVRRIVNVEWNFRTPIRGRTGGKPLARSAVYRILRDDFYAGRVRWLHHLAAGEHDPMVTEEEFMRVQELLDTRCRNKRREGIVGP